MLDLLLEGPCLPHTVVICAVRAPALPAQSCPGGGIGGGRRGPLRALFATLLQEFGDDAGPSRLMVGSDSRAVVTVEVLVEEDEVPPVRVLLELLDASVDRAPPVGVPQEDAGVATGQLGGDIPQGHELPGARGALDLETVAVEMVEPLDRLDQQEVHRYPDRPAPVGVAAE